VTGAPSVELPRAGVAARLRAAVWPADPVLRVLSVATLVNTLGNGAFFTVSALYFTRIVGISAGHLGLALTVAGLCGLLAAVPIGHLADRRGPREVLRLLLVVLAALTVGYLFVGTTWQLAVMASLVSVADRGSNAVRNALTATLSHEGDRVRFRAYLRAVTNVGISVGTLLAGVALAVDTRSAYLSVFVLNAVTFLGTAVVLGRLPHVPPVPAATSGPALRVLRDRPYVAATALNAVFAMHFGLIEVGVPLWVAQRTSAPTWFVSVLLLVNTVACVLFQVRVARGRDAVPDAARAYRTAGLFVGGACLVFAAAADEPLWLAVPLLLAAAGLHVFGEMLGSAGQWGVSMGLAPAESQGQYQGFSATGFAASEMVMPLAVTLLCIEWGRPGWVVLGAIFAVTAAALPPVAGWALRTRARYGVTTHSG
jgi:MFS family permease